MGLLLGVSMGKIDWIVHLFEMGNHPPRTNLKTYEFGVITLFSQITDMSLNTYEILNDKQFEFRSNHPTSMAILSW